jgi:ribosomal protein S18 acetylase RimI-like enzyme
MTYSIQRLGPADAELLLDAHPEVFDFPIDPEWTREFLNDPRHHIVVAVFESQVIGSVTATHYVHPDQPPTLFIIEVGVAPEHQQRGLARKMLQAMFDHGRSLGCTTAWVGTEGDNDAARKLYLSAGGALDEDDFVTYSFDLEE